MLRRDELVSRLHTLVSTNSITNLNQLKQIQAQIISQSLLYHDSNYWASLLIQQCTRLHTPLSHAVTLFNSVPHPNVRLFTSMLKFYSQSNSDDDAFLLFSRMRTQPQFKMDSFVFPVLIKLAAAKENGKEGVCLHGYVLKLGFYSSDPYVRNAVMDMYGKHGDVGLARQVFDEMPHRVVADWNSMISAYWKWGYAHEAVALFRMMQSDANVVSWTAMISGCAKCGRLDEARDYFDRMPHQLKTVVTWNAMISGYAQNGLPDEAIRLFERMIDNDGHNVEPDETTWVAVISSCSAQHAGDPKAALSLLGSLLDRKRLRLNYFVRTALLDMHAKCGDLATARRIFDEMGHRHRNRVSWNAMISAYARTGDLASARALFDEMPDRDVVSWNSMIAGYAQNGHSALAVDLFREMTTAKPTTNQNHHRPPKPDEVTMLNVTSACAHLGALDSAKWVADFIQNHRIRLTLPGHNALISMYSRCGSMADATKIFRQMKTRDVVSYNSLIAGFASHGRGPEALELLSKMRDEEALEPDKITYIGVLTACSHAGLFEEGRRVFESIQTPSVDHYSCTVDLLGRAGRVDEAKALVDRMPMTPHAGVYGALLNASRIHRRVDLGEFAAYKLFELEPQNSGNYTLLANLYASVGRWKDSSLIMETMNAKGVNKMVGCSWVEYDGTVHQFTAHDRSHERLPEIHRVLGELRTKMRALTGYLADKSFVLRDVEEEEKEDMVGTHSEKLAIGFALIVSEPGAVIRVVKNLRVCGDCHAAIKAISKLTRREIIVRDNNRFHCFKDGECSCMDYW